jgi:DNA-binding GntR family transcriptional regulator
MQPNKAIEMIAETVPIRDKVYEAIRAEIVSGQIKPGERLIETEYADKYHVSRSPIREALRRLEADGLLEYRNRIGMFVRVFSREEIIEIYTIRKALECLAMENAMARITERDIAQLHNILDRQINAYRQNNTAKSNQCNSEFHSYMINMGKMPTLAGILEGLDAGIRIFATVSMSDDARRKSAIAEHRAILTCMEQHDQKGTLAAMIRHIDTSLEQCLKQYQIFG